MICFEVSINGQKHCIAGVGETGVLSAILSWVKSKNHQKSEIEETTQPNLPHFHVGGLVNDEHFDYLEHPFHVNIGDEITIKVLELDTCDIPLWKHPARSPEEKKEERRRRFEKLKKEFEG